ncbi:MAG: peptide-methionine (S)-S-oxide reductase MsrA [Granulosicoccus sp.]
MFGSSEKNEMPNAENALPGRDEPLSVASQHVVTGNAMKGPYAAHLETIVFGMGCFWGVERLFWNQAGVFATAVGYIGGATKNPAYEEVCTGNTGHNEVVQVIFAPAIISLSRLLQLFWQSHDPTQGMQQGPDRGTQYRSGIYTSDPAQLRLAEASREKFQQVLEDKHFGAITTEILPASVFYYAEDYHQQYLHKNPGGYCSLRGTGCSMDESTDATSTEHKVNIRQEVQA